MTLYILNDWAGEAFTINVDGTQRYTSTFDGTG